MRKVALILALCGLAACGADGEPETPKYTTSATVGVGSSGTHVSTYTTASTGRWTVGVGLGL